jgi:hydroxymethylpyrimidine pyrophosphatase-like HAD family hydrolase
VTLLGMPEPIQRILGSIREKYWQKREVALFNPDPQVIQVTHRLVDKGIALQRVAQRMEADREQVMVIADADNDLGMMEWAGLAIAVANATDQVKQLADAVVPSNDDQGVARAIHRYILTRR